MQENIPDISINKLHSNVTYTKREISAVHKTYYFEQHYLGLLRQGNVKALKELFSTVPDIESGTVADSPLRQIKNLFIAATTTATRAAIEGGLTPVEAYNLSDIYILQMEKLSSTMPIYILQYQMILDFAQRVADCKLPSTKNSSIFRCTQYIASHVNEPLTVQSVADYIGLSRPYLSRRFSEELGFSVSAFIQRCKIEEAKTLLRHTDKTISEISNYLCFSSQSYFQNVFKKNVGTTPDRYRHQR